LKKDRRFSLPGKTGLEGEMQSLGLSSKQADKARQTFMRSAKQAGFFAHGEDRLVMPSVTQLPNTKPIEPLKPKGEEDGEDEYTNGSGGGGPTDPLIHALIQKLPRKGPWSASERVTWLKMLAMAFQMSYGPEPEMEIKEAAN
jgi:hypothetical protein